MSETTTTARVPADLAGQRADRVVAVVFDLSRAESRRLVDEGKVTSGGEPVAAKAKLAAGLELTVDLPEQPDGIEPLDAPLEIRYQSGETLVIDKPPGLVVHPGAGHRNDTLASVLLHHFPELAELADEHRWGLVHRLDRDTSGLLLVARTGAAHTGLQAQLKQRSVSRVYQALVAGTVDPSTGTIEAPIGRDPDHPTRMALRQDGRFARTHYRKVARWEEASLLEVRLETGRTHQIRVHLSSIGYPIIGDRTYGSRRASSVADPGRVWLHAAELTFVDPASGETVTVESPLPADLHRSLQALGEPLSGELPAAGGVQSP